MFRAEIRKNLFEFLFEILNGAFNEDKKSHEKSTEQIFGLFCTFFTLNGILEE